MLSAVPKSTLQRFEYALRELLLFSEIAYEYNLTQYLHYRVRSMSAVTPRFLDS